MVKVTVASNPLVLFLFLLGLAGLFVLLICHSTRCVLFTRKRLLTWGVCQSEEGEHRFSHGPSIDRERGWRNRQFSRAADYDDEMTGEGRGEGSDGDQLARGARVASDDQQDGDEGDEDI